MKFVFTAALVLVFSYSALLVFVRIFSNRIIFPAPLPTYEKSDGHVFIKLADGDEIGGVYLPAKGSQYCILYSHGNGEDLGMIDPLLRAFQSSGVSVFAYDYVGYGISKGEPSELKLYAAADAAWDYVRNVLGYHEKDIIIFGYSLGSAPSTHLAAKHSNIRGLILAGAFSKGVHAILPWNILPWKILDNSARLKNVEAPVLMLHGERDFIVHPRNARMNFAAAKPPARLVWFSERGHHDLLESEDYWAEIFNFINTATNEKSIGHTVR